MFFVFYFVVWNQCLVWNHLVSVAYEVALLLPLDIEPPVEAMSRILLSPFMLTTITNYMTKRCDKHGTLYVRPKWKANEQPIFQYNTTADATPRIFLRAKDNKILKDPKVSSLDIAMWGSEVINGVFEPRLDYSVIAAPDTTQDKKNARGMCRHVYRT